jgi:hypothetical protein
VYVCEFSIYKLGRDYQNKIMQAQPVKAAVAAADMKLTWLFDNRLQPVMCFVVADAVDTTLRACSQYPEN